jgi:hypothetical protein
VFVRRSIVRISSIAARPSVSEPPPAAKPPPVVGNFERQRILDINIRNENNEKENFNNFGSSGFDIVGAWTLLFFTYTKI